MGSTPMFALDGARSSLSMIGTESSLQPSPSGNSSITGGVWIVGDDDQSVIEITGGGGKRSLSCSNIAITTSTNQTDHPDLISVKGSDYDMYLAFFNCFLAHYTTVGDRSIFGLTGDGHLITHISRSTYWFMQGNGRNIIFDTSIGATTQDPGSVQMELRDSTYHIGSLGSKSNVGGAYASSYSNSAAQGSAVVNTGNNRFENYGQFSPGITNWYTWYDTAVAGPSNTVIFQNDSSSMATFVPFQTAPPIVFVYGSSINAPFKLRETPKINKT
jgi:hypothetical protein